MCKWRICHNTSRNKYTCISNSVKPDGYTRKTVQVQFVNSTQDSLPVDLNLNFVYVKVKIKAAYLPDVTTHCIICGCNIVFPCLNPETCSRVVVVQTHFKDNKADSGKVFILLPKNHRLLMIWKVHVKPLRMSEWKLLSYYFKKVKSYFM